MKERFLARMHVPAAWRRAEEVVHHGPFEDRLEAMRWAEGLEKTWPEGTTWRTESLWDPTMHESPATRSTQLVETADFWYRGAMDESYSMAERLSHMTEAFRHTQNMLCGVVEEDDGHWMARMKARLAELRAKR